MKMISFLMVVCTVLFSCQNQSERATEARELPVSTAKEDAQVSKTSETDLLGTWKFTYANSTSESIEDHYMLIEKGSEGLKGFYYGTTDDFDEAREGYLPGFFMTDMENISLNNDTISFTLSVLEDDLYQSPIRPGIKSLSDVQSAKWENGLSINTRDYIGIYKGGRIIFDIHLFGRREFIKQK